MNGFLQNSLVEQPDFGDLSDDLEIDVAGHQVRIGFIMFS